jgi:hypothetical protein
MQLTPEQQQVIDRAVDSAEPTAGLRLIGEGSYRDVYALGNGLVLKACRRDDATSRRHNIMEFLLSRQLPKLTAHVFWCNGLYLIQEQVRKIRPNELFADNCIQEQYARLRYHFVDAAKLNNVGIVKRDGETRLVMADCGSGLRA